jgi:hypothetical protein
MCGYKLLEPLVIETSSPSRKFKKRERKYHKL